MKNFIKVILVSVMLLPISAMAEWVATASSPSAWGTGYSMDRATAQAIALNECARRTPFGQTCYITHSYWR